MKRLRAAFISVVPSPYQRDIFAALAARPDLDMRAFYMEKAAPDSPWPERPLAAYESILPGRWFALGQARCHVNFGLPSPRDYDVVVLNTVMSITAQWLMRARLGRTPWVFWGERLRPRGAGPRQRIHDFLTGPLRGAAAIAGIGRLADADYHARFPEPAHANIPYHCQLQPFLETPVKPRGERTVFLFCGQMIARKGLDLLLRAFAQLVEENPSVELRLAGREADLPGELQKLPAKAVERIVYEGFLAPEDLPKFFAKADVFILPSRYDGWGVVVNQALGAGLPLLCADTVGAAHDLIEEGVNGSVFPAGDEEALLQRMRMLAADADRREAWGRTSREKALDWLPEKGAAKWMDLLRQIA